MAGQGVGKNLPTHVEGWTIQPTAQAGENHQPSSPMTSTAAMASQTAAGGETR